MAVESESREGLLASKIAEAQEMIKTGDIKNRGKASDLSATISWYWGLRKSYENGDYTPGQQAVIDNQTAALESHGYTYEDLDKKFGELSQEELIELNKRVFVF